jgi:hypothetical protein
MDWMTEEQWFNYQQGQKTFFHSVQTSSEAQPTSYPMGITSLFPGVKL